MKAKDLMIGDLVYIKAYKADENFQKVEFQKPVRIAGIENIVTVEDPSNDKEPYRMFGNTEIEPIPLTLEILKKNGFSKFVAGQYLCANKEEDWFILVMPGLHTAPNSKHRYLVSCKHIYTDAKIAINYVHELQHALRLCGIEKEIIAY